MSRIPRTTTTVLTLLLLAAGASATAATQATDDGLLAANEPARVDVDPAMSDDSTAPAPATAIASGTLHGQHHDIDDIRLRAGFLPEHATAGGHDFDWDHNLSVGVLYVQAPQPLSQYGGFIWGAEGSFNNGGRDNSGDHIAYYGFMGDIMGGWAYRMPHIPNLHFEGTPFVGIGFDHFTSEQNGKPTSFAFEYGFRASAMWTFINFWQAGLDLRLMDNRAKPSFEGPDGDVTVETSGVAVLFTGGKRF